MHLADVLQVGDERRKASLAKTQIQRSDLNYYVCKHRSCPLPGLSPAIGDNYSRFVHVRREKLHPIREKLPRREAEQKNSK